MGSLWPLGYFSEDSENRIVMDKDTEMKMVPPMFDLLGFLELVAVYRYFPSLAVDSPFSTAMDEKKEIPSVVYQFNSSINLFRKAKMMDDALKTYRRMQEMKIQPTKQTLTYLLYAILWGNIKRNMESENLVASEARTEAQLIEEKFNMNWDDLLQDFCNIKVNRGELRSEYGVKLDSLRYRHVEKKSHSWCIAALIDQNQLPSTAPSFLFEGFATANMEDALWFSDETKLVLHL
ncbi:unnamed protein product [Prunus armeniaca]|uniref:Pentatricopeptide repeat-containing protein n=1 Tax=Prunus armeniaca TaxID=36596 RepID=A0A6J5VDZ8_PRUAR|nr:unnamed protein product [Prunus armeniaca]